VNNILDLTALAPLVQSAARSMRYPLERDSFVLRVTLADPDVRVACDSDAIEQAILNLLSNAMKYSDTNRAIDLTLSRANGDAIIAVSDRGIGIPPAERSRIFQKFFRGSAADRQRVAGTGLGLTIVEHTVHAHGGTIEVESEPGLGSTFRILLPAFSADCESSAPLRVPS
jgi:signal transduction histidine kinase